MARNGKEGPREEEEGAWEEFALSPSPMSVLPQLQQSDILQAIQVSRHCPASLRVLSPTPAHRPSLQPLAPNRRPTPAQTPPARTLRNPEETRGLGAHHPLTRTSRSECTVLRCSHGPGQDRQRLVKSLGKLVWRVMLNASILRDYFPRERVEDFRDLFMQLVAHSVAAGRSKIVLRKLFVAVCGVAIRSGDY